MDADAGEDGRRFPLIPPPTFFFSLSFPRSCRNPNPVPPSPGALCPGLKGSCRGGPGGRGPDPRTSLDRCPPSPSISISTTLNSTSIPTTGGHRYRTRRGFLGGKVSSHQTIAPPFSPPKKKKSSNANSINASTLGCAAMAWRHPPQLKSAPSPFSSHCQ